VLVHRPADRAHPVGGELLAVRLERDAEAEHVGERPAEVLGDEGEELVLLRFELRRRREVAHHPLEARDLGALPAGLGEDLDHPPHTVAAHDGQLHPAG
jgi:hypothetical protein